MPLRDDAVRAIVRASMIVEVATLSPRQRPFVTPLWFVLDGDAIVLTTGPESRAGKNLAANPEVALLFAGERGGERRRAVRLRGRATVERGLPPWRLLWRIALKYYLPPPAVWVELRHRRLWPLRRRYYAQSAGGAGYIRVVPASAEIVAVP